MEKNAYGYIHGFLSDYLKMDMTSYEPMHIKYLQNGTDSKKLKNVRKKAVVVQYHPPYMTY